MPGGASPASPLWAAGIQGRVVGRPALMLGGFGEGKPELYGVDQLHGLYAVHG